MYSCVCVSCLSFFFFLGSQKKRPGRMLSICTVVEVVGNDVQLIPMSHMNQLVSVDCGIDRSWGMAFASLTNPQTPTAPAAWCPRVTSCTCARRKSPTADGSCATSRWTWNRSLPSRAASGIPSWFHLYLVRKLFILRWANPAFSTYIIVCSSSYQIRKCPGFWT